MLRSMSMKRPKSLTETVTNRVRQAIIDGELPFGTTVSEDALAEALQVSRTPVREALSQLQREGLIDIIPQRGSFVFTPDEQDIIELCEYRLTLEVRAANLSMQRNPEGLLEVLDEIIAEMMIVLGNNQLQNYAVLDWRYHLAMFRFCNNRYMKDAYTLASGKIASLSTNVTRPFPHKRTESVNEHKMMLAHLRDTRIDAFERVLSEHIGRTRGVYLHAMVRGGLAQTTGEELNALRLDKPTESP